MKLKTTTQLFPNLSNLDSRMELAELINTFFKKKSIFKVNNICHLFRPFFFKVKLISLLIFLFCLNSNGFGQIAQRGTVTSKAQTSTSTTTLVINKPTGVVSGDVMIVNISQYCNNTGATDANSSGWTKIASCQPGGSTYSKATLLYRVADGTEGASFTFNINKPNYTVGAIIAFSGVDVSGGVGVGGSGSGPFSATTGSFSTTMQSANSITTTSSSAVVMFGVCTNYDRNYNNWSTATSPGALTELYDVVHGSNWASVGAAWASSNNIGATGAGSVTLSSITTTYWGGILVALKAIPSCSSPSIQATSFAYSNIAEQSMTLGWTRGNGNNVMIVAKAGSAPTDPTSGTSYTANAAYASGTACGGGYVVYSGTGTSVNLSGLTGGTTYYFAAYEFNTTGTCYNTTELTGSSATLNQETWIGVTSIDWNIGSNWSSGYVPTSATNVTIPSGTPFAPTISASANAVCKNLTINSSATLTENAPSIYYFAIYGNIICNGTFISANFVELNGGLVSDFATISGTGDLSDLSVDLGYDNNIGFYKLLNDITLGEFYLDSYWGNSIFDMNGYNFTVDFFSLESSTTFYQKTGILSIEDPAATIDDISFVEATGTTYFSRGTIWVASSDQTIPSITYYNLKVRANNGVTVTIGSGTAFSVAGDLTVFNPSTAGGVVSLVENVTVSGNTLIGTSGNALTLNLSKRIIGTGTFTMGNLVAHAINISFAHATNFAITCSGAPTFYGTVTYTSASAQKVITATSYNNLTFDLAGTKTLFGNLDVNGNLTMTAGTFDMSTFNVNLAGDLVKQTAATLTANTATFTLDGTSTQYVNVTAASGATACNADITFYNLVIDGSDVKLYYNKTNNRKYNTNDFTVNSGKQVSVISQ
jgi:hypothetical protein